MNSGYNNSDRYPDNEPAVEYDPSPDELVSLARDIRNGVAPDFDESVASRLEAIASAFWECIRMNQDVNERYRALLSQPTPTAEQKCTCYPVPEHLHTTHYGATDPASMWEPNPDCPVHFPTAEPSGMEGLAPGTTFMEGDVRWSVGLQETAQRLPDGHTTDLRMFDPSTIRDVTPPPTTT